MTSINSQLTQEKLPRKKGNIHMNEVKGKQGASSEKWWNALQKADLWDPNNTNSDPEHRQMWYKCKESRMTKVLSETGDSSKM